MDTFTLVRSALAASEKDEDRADLPAQTREIGRITAAVQTVVDALTPPDGGRYIVGFVDVSTAATDLSARRIIVSRKPLSDRSLSLVEKAVVVATFAAHEIGHTIITRPRAALIKAHNPKSGYHAVANLADDIVLEPYMADRYPILRDAFAFTGLWVLRNTAKNLPKVERGGWETTPERFNTLISATRYGDIADIVWADAKARRERDWARGWAARLVAADTRDHATFLALCDEAWERIRTKDADEEEPQGGGGEPCDDGDPTDEPNDEPQPGDEPGEGEDGEGEDGDDATQPGDEPGEDGDEQGDEPGDDATDGEDGDGDPNEAPRDWDDEDGEDGDEPGEGEDESDGTDGSGESMDGADESDEQGDEPGDEDGEGDMSGSDVEDGEGQPDSDSDGEGGGGNAHANADDMRDEDEWNDDDVDESTHSEANPERWDYGASEVEEAIRTYTNTSSTAFGRHGKISTTWS